MSLALGASVLGAVGHLANLGQFVEIGQGHAYQREQMAWARRAYCLDSRALRIDLLNAVKEDVRDHHQTYAGRIDTLLLVHTLLLTFALATLQYSDQFLPSPECENCTEHLHPWLVVAWVYSVSAILIFPFWSMVMLIWSKLQLDRWLESALGRLNLELRGSLAANPVSETLPARDAALAGAGAGAAGAGLQQAADAASLSLGALAEEGAPFVATTATSTTAATAASPSTSSASTTLKGSGLGPLDDVADGEAMLDRVEGAVTRLSAFVIDHQESFKRIWGKECRLMISLATVLLWVSCVLAIGITAGMFWLFLQNHMEDHHRHAASHFAGATLVGLLAPAVYALAVGGPLAQVSEDIPAEAFEDCIEGPAPPPVQDHRASEARSGTLRRLGSRVWGAMRSTWRRGQEQEQHYDDTARNWYHRHDDGAAASVSSGFRRGPRTASSETEGEGEGDGGSGVAAPASDERSGALSGFRQAISKAAASPLLQWWRARRSGGDPSSREVFAHGFARMDDDGQGLDLAECGALHLAAEEAAEAAAAEARGLVRSQGWAGRASRTGQSHSGRLGETRKEQREEWEQEEDGDAMELSVGPTTRRSSRSRRANERKRGSASGSASAPGGGEQGGLAPATSSSASSLLSLPLPLPNLQLPSSRRASSTSSASLSGGAGLGEAEQALLDKPLRRPSFLPTEAEGS